MTNRTAINSTGDTVRETIVYSAAGEMIYDSSAGVSNSVITSTVFKYELGNSGIRSTIITNGQPFFISNYNIQKDQNGNIITEKDSINMYTAGVGFNFWKVNNYTTTYDNNPCPFYKLHPKKPVNYEPFANDIETFYQGVTQKNNILSEVSNSTMPPSPTIINSHSYSYTYLSNGYPATVIITNDITGQVNKGIFVY
jgi:hypothetical protein